MRRLGAGLILLLALGLPPGALAAGLLTPPSPASPTPAPQPQEPLPAAFAAIRAVPADLGPLERHAILTTGSGEEGDDLPSSISYNPAHPADYATFLTVTDLSLCRRPAERACCAAFQVMIAGPQPALGADITASRISGAGYHTVFLAPLPGVRLAGVDAMRAFLGCDSQDAPRCQPVVYIYARRGSNLLQLAAPAGSCDAPARPHEADAAYFRRTCLGSAALARARTAAEHLAELFRLAP